MENADLLLLARAQFGLNIGFHILFPSLTIALGWILLFFRIQYARTGNAAWLATYNLWTKIFALSFAMGVVTGIVMSMQFGMKRVPSWVHIFSAAMVAIGTTLSAFWILALNSWMQTPTGHVMDGNVLIAGDWWNVIFNPSLPYRVTHMLIASGLTAAFFLIGLSAWRLLRAAADESARSTLRTGLLIAAVLVPAQIQVGDLHGLNTLEHQPAKIAAIEALWETRNGAPLVLFAVPNEDTRRNDYAIEIPRLASRILRHDADGEVK